MAITELEQTALEDAKTDGFLLFPAKDFSIDFARKWDNWRWANRWPRIMAVSHGEPGRGPHVVACDCTEAVPPTPTRRFIEILVPPLEREGFEVLVSDECMTLLDSAFQYEFEDYGRQTPIPYSSGPDIFMREEMPQEQAIALARRAAEIVREDRLSEP